MNPDQPIVVVLTADSRFTKQLAVVIAGIAESARRKHKVFVLHDGYEPALMDQISGIAGASVSLGWLDARSIPFGDVRLRRGLPTAGLFRLRMGDFLPREFDRLIYIDTDTVIRSRLDELWEMNLNGRAVGAVRDPVVPWAASPQGLPWSSLAVPPDSPYFNAGVLVVDTVRWRSERIPERALELLVRCDLPHGGQSALNAVLAGQWFCIEPRWNLQAGHLAGDTSLAWVTESHDALAAAIADPAIVHFNRSRLRRPWERGCTHPYRDLWFDSLDRTPWAGQRRPKQRPRLRSRISKAASVLRRG